VLTLSALILSMTMTVAPAAPPPAGAAVAPATTELQDPFASKRIADARPPRKLREVVDPFAASRRVRTTAVDRSGVKSPFTAAKPDLPPARAASKTAPKSPFAG
jgi:hypothetical protein